MSGRPDGRIEKGQRIGSAISARAWNRAQDAADIVLGVAPALEAGPVQGPAAACLTVLVKNDTPNDIPVGGWLTIRHRALNSAAETFLPDNQIAINTPGRTEVVQPVFLGSSYLASTIDSELAEFDIVVAVEPIKAGAFGRCAFEGIVPARISVTGPSGDPLAQDSQPTGSITPNNAFPGPWYNENPWHAVPQQGQTTVLVPHSNNTDGVRPARILWIENQVATGPTGVTGPAYRNGLVRLVGSDVSNIRHVLFEQSTLQHVYETRASAGVDPAAIATGVACDSQGKPIVRYTYSGGTAVTGPHVVQFHNFLRPHKQIGPSGCLLTVVRQRQQIGRMSAQGAILNDCYWAVASDHPHARGVYYSHGNQPDWQPGDLRTVTFFGMQGYGELPDQEFSGTVLNMFGIITTSFEGLAVADANGAWVLVSCPFSVLKEYADINSRMSQIEARLAALENA